MSNLKRSDSSAAIRNQLKKNYVIVPDVSPRIEIDRYRTIANAVQEEGYLSFGKKDYLRAYIDLQKFILLSSKIAGHPSYVSRPDIKKWVADQTARTFATLEHIVRKMDEQQDRILEEQMDRRLQATFDEEDEDIHIPKPTQIIADISQTIDTIQSTTTISSTSFSSSNNQKSDISIEEEEEIMSQAYSKRQESQRLHWEDIPLTANETLLTTTTTAAAATIITTSSIASVTPMVSGVQQLQLNMDDLSLLEGNRSLPPPPPPLSPPPPPPATLPTTTTLNASAPPLPPQSIPTVNSSVTTNNVPSKLQVLLPPATSSTNNNNSSTSISNAINSSSSSTTSSAAVTTLVHRPIDMSHYANKIITKEELLIIQYLLQSPQYVKYYSLFLNGCLIIFIFIFE
jgi:hypothetical protein